jgi:predicted acetyltransferase
LADEGTVADVEISIRRASGDDLAAIAELDGASFGTLYSEQELQDMATLLDLDRFLLAIDRDRIVGITGDYPFEMTVPGGRLDVPGVTWVSVDATYRRRGILRKLMRRQLEEYREAGLAAAVLTASEGGIYGRFGYGVASHVRKTSIDRRRVNLRTPGDLSAVTRATPTEARKQMPALHERWRAQTPGALSRTDAWWDFLTLDRDWQRGGMSGMFYLLHRDGYIAYRIKSEWSDGDPRHACWISDYVITSLAAHADLWQVLLGMDLVGPIESYRIPMDDPISLLVDDGRQVRTTHVGDGLWVRPLDVPAMLTARRYAVGVEVSIAVRDDMFGDATYLLRGDSAQAECFATDSAPDLELDVAALGAVYLGGVRLDSLARAGLVEAHRPDSLVRLDRALLADRLPMYGTAF